ncbi:MAG: 5-formyltetrahydrofolate cyclo-ligase [Flavobacteriaceae bacterium]|nr:5-formyltetrahydrofolate cyclo-ligase [Flavobacteriaceae bacterium]
MINNNKLFLRQLFKKERSLLSPNQVKTSSKLIFKNLMTLNIWEKIFYHSYLSNVLNNEVETNEIINLLFKKNKRVFVPKILGTNLIHIEINKNTSYSKNQLGIREPVNSSKSNPDLLEVIFVPLLAFDKQGDRVGYGGGYYDKFLGDIKNNALKIGLSLFEPIDKILDIEDHDISLDYIITPKRVYNFS